MKCYVVVLENGEQELHLLSPFSGEELRTTSSRSELFMGHLNEPAIGVIPGNISYNKDFLVHMHALIRDIMVNDPDILEEVQKQKDGMVIVVDRRSPAVADNFASKVDPEDILGVFTCHEYKTDVTRYIANPNYLLISEKGIGQLPLPVEAELAKLISK